jgi:hypothetical protein
MHIHSLFERILSSFVSFSAFGNPSVAICQHYWHHFGVPILGTNSLFIAPVPQTFEWRRHLPWSTAVEDGWRWLKYGEIVFANFRPFMPSIEVYRVQNGCNYHISPRGRMTVLHIHGLFQAFQGACLASVPRRNAIAYCAISHS